MASAVSGAYLGIEALPVSWLAKVENREIWKYSSYAWPSWWPEAPLAAKKRRAKAPLASPFA